MRTATVVLLVFAGLSGCLDANPVSVDPHLAGIPEHWSPGDSAPPLNQGGPWFNTDAPIDVDDLHGRVFMVDFWTYSCVKCIRTFPHLDGLYNTYKDLGFTIIGVHSPEFEFEKDADNVQSGIERYGIDYPVVMDNDFDIWRLYQGHGGYWPAHFLFDADGTIREYHRGEGDYYDTEQHVRQLLTEAGHVDLPPAYEVVGDASAGGSGRTPELFAGYKFRTTWAIGNEEGRQPGQEVTYSADGADRRDRIFLDGTWDNGAETMTAVTNGSIHLWFNAGASNVVLEGPMGACVEVHLDGQPIPPELAGVDITYASGVPCIVLEEAPRSYDFYAGPFEEHRVHFVVPAGLGLYSFAFSNQAMQ